MGKALVALARTRPEYPRSAPFGPAVQYPELAGQDVSQEGWVYDAVREVLRAAELDAGAFGSPAWNPFAGLVQPGQRVVIKPNLVLDFNTTGAGLDCLVTHASVLRPIVDYALKALNGRGEVIIADSPHGNARFSVILQANGLGALADHYRRIGAPVSVRDVRKYEYGFGPGGFVAPRRIVDRDPDGYVEVDLGASSSLASLPHLENLYGADFDRAEIRRHHDGRHHRYLIARTFLLADTIINVPKLKTHKKVGATLNLKSVIGINGDKNYLPHYRIGDPEHGGDEFPDTRSDGERWARLGRRWIFDRFLAPRRAWGREAFRVVNRLYAPLERRLGGSALGIGSGDWYGNRTVHRTCFDLARIALCADADGRLHSTPRRRFFSIIDGVVGGQGGGPLAPTPHPAGVLIAGQDMVATDMVAVRLMGFAPERLPLFTDLVGLPVDHPLAPVSVGEIRVETEFDAWRRPFDGSGRLLAFTPHPAWEGHIEVGG